MNRLFIHKPLFRIISPLFSGTIVYLLILLINNNVTALDELFLGQELYFCMGLSYLIHEFSRLIIMTLSRIHWLAPTFIGLSLPFLICTVMVLVVVTGSLFLYFEQVLGFSPAQSELIIFNAIFMMISWIYLSLFVMYDILKKSHDLKLQQEQELKQHLVEEFSQFKDGINPALLFESLEQLIVLSRTDINRAEELLDLLAVVYRYVLSRKKELVSIALEVEALNGLVRLLNELPARTIEATSSVHSDFLVVPGVLLKILETTLKQAIVSPENPLVLELNEEDELLRVSAGFIKQLDMADNTANLMDQLHKSYRLYSEEEVKLNKQTDKYVYSIPKLTLAP
ncbi:histidine kinase [Marinoscillum sp.]|uniref:histidine kinase n=1 Tax=Marinoscillum sp. TaxID=2024838 RepID=UPI003BAC1CD9